MAKNTRVFKFTFGLAYKAESEDDAREMLQKDINDNVVTLFGFYDANDWECKELSRDESTEWLFGAFENNEAQDGDN